MFQKATVKIFIGCVTFVTFKSLRQVDAGPTKLDSWATLLKKLQIYFQNCITQ